MEDILVLAKDLTDNGLLAWSGNKPYSTSLTVSSVIFRLNVSDDNFRVIMKNNVLGTIKDAELVAPLVSAIDTQKAVTPLMQLKLHMESMAVVSPEYPTWIQPTGAHDAYNTGDRVTWNGILWESTIDANVWEPGVSGWKQVV